MNNKKDVHVALQESFKKLILKHNFDKITIKMITDDAGLITTIMQINMRF